MSDNTSRQRFDKAIGLVVQYVAVAVALCLLVLGLVMLLRLFTGMAFASLPRMSPTDFAYVAVGCFAAKRVLS